MPSGGVTFIPHAEILRYEELERVIAAAIQFGMAKIRLTGGEPLLRSGAVEFAGRLGALPGLQKLSLTTNGLLLAQHAAALQAGGVGYVNISLDTLDREKFQHITGCDGLASVLDGIRAAKRAGFAEVKVNVVSVRGFNDDELFDFVDFADQFDLTVRFIEYMPFHGNGWQADGFLPSAVLQDRLTQRYPLRPLADDPAAPARIYAIPGKRGRLGFISSVSHSFCDQCNRLRLTADGHLRPCLHGSAEVDLKGPLRRGASEADLRHLFEAALAQKPRAHRDFFAPADPRPAHDREMVRIGG